MLHIPLLGRPKVPLNQVVAVAQAEGIRDLSPATPVGSDSTTPLSTVTAEETQRPGIPSNTDILSEQVDQSQSVSITTLEDTSKAVKEPITEQKAQETQDNSQEQQDTAALPPSSWWNYIGWGGTQPKETTQLPSIFIDVAPPMEHTESTGTEFLSAVSTESPVVISDTQSSLSPLPSPAQDFDADDTTESASIAPAEGQSSWLTPWNWYSGSAATPPPPRSPLPPVEEENERGLTESQMIREAALARPSQSPAPVVESNKAIGTVKDDGEAYSDEVNPIRSTVEANRSGWTSFFMAKSIKSVTEHGEKKSIGNESGNGEMEVMEVPDPEDLPPEVIATGTSTTTAATATPAPMTSGPSTVAAIMDRFVPKSPAPSVKSSSSKVLGSPAQPLKEIERGEKEPKKDSPAPPLTNSENVKKETTKKVSERPSSPSPSKRSGASTPISARNGPQNLVLPTWEDTFHAPPRSLLLPSIMRKEDGRAEYVVTRTIKMLWSKGREAAGMGSVKGKERAGSLGTSGKANPSELGGFGKSLPRALGVLGDQMDPKVLHGMCRIVVIGIAGWSPGAMTRKIAGGLPSSSAKFVNMTCDALASFEEEHGVKFAKVTKIPLEGDGTISRKVEKVYQHLLSSEEWVNDIHAADVIFVSAHSQGSIVSTHLIDLLIRDGHVITSASTTQKETQANSATESTDGVWVSTPESSSKGRQRICCLSLCGIHLGPLRYLKLSSFIQPYIQYFENAAAQEIFEFQNTDNAVSREYVKALSNIMHHGTKMVYVASLNDQVVPIYSGIFATADHPRILRALYIDGDAYHSSDFLSNLLVLLLRIMNAGLSDSGLLTHLSEATAGSLSGVGHSSVYEDPGVFELAVKYQFLAHDGDDSVHQLKVDSFNAVQELNDYEIPWSLRDLIANERVARFFSREFVTLRDTFGDWQPKTSILRDVKRKLQPIQRLSLIERTAPPTPEATTAVSKL
ncbi:hypothetical protein BDM02DRAFT_3155438 [Thelephora ganbajun]|uniref:Uncharacterized protein n=1 Tax=Thelephora ganbajun TaxID=370292 RepID=A0ACB6ZHX1_THEGA|nr:hypothetical protein BDM02DRAFT_3155438 [Thelephora ganbajun]